MSSIFKHLQQFFPTDLITLRIIWDKIYSEDYLIFLQLGKWILPNYGGVGKMFKRIFLGLVMLVIVIISRLDVLAQDKEEILSLVYERPYPDVKVTRGLKATEEVEYTPLFLEEGEFSEKESKTLGLKANLKGKNKTVSICYPKVVIKETPKKEEKELLFLDKFGKVKKRYLLPDWVHIQWSENNKYLCVEKSTYGDYREGTQRVKRTILDAEGNELWNYEDSPADDFYVSPTGDYVIEIPDCDYGRRDEMTIHYQRGKDKELILPSNITHYVDFSENGEYFCVTTGACLLLFDKHGNELWRRKGGGFGTEDPYFLKNEFIGAISSGIIGDENISDFYLYDIKGNLLWKNRVFLSIQDVYYLESEGKVYVLSGWGHFYLFDIKTGQLLAKYSDENAPTYKPASKGISNPLAPKWRGIIVNPDLSKIITLAVRSAYYEGDTERVDIFNKNLKKLGQREYPDKYIKVNFYEPVIKFSRDNLLAIMTKGGLEIYEVK